MQLNLFFEEPKQIEQKPKPNPGKYYYMIRFEQRLIKVDSLTWTNETQIKTIHAVYTDLEKVREMVNFLKSLQSYCGWYHIIRTEEMPSLNYSKWSNYL